MSDEQKRDQAAREQVVWRNRKILARRMRWPDGALQACEDLDRRYPGWTIMWAPANSTPGYEQPAGFLAVSLRDDLHLSAGTVQELRAALDAELRLRKYGDQGGSDL